MNSAQRPPTDASPKRVLVSGGAGFVGSHLVENLLDRGDRVTVIDDLSTGQRTNIRHVLGRIEFIEGDLAETLRSLDAAPQKTGHEPNDGPFDEIYHLAAAVGVERVLQRPVESIETNIDQTAAVLRFAGTHGIPTLITSSSEVYGKSSSGVFNEDDDVVYGPTSVTRWSYAASKAIDEHLALAYHRAQKMPVVIVRLFNTVGPRQVGSYGMVIPRFIEAALDDAPIRVFGDGTQSRCFSDVRDIAPALPTLLRTPAAHGEVFNLGSDRPISIGELAELVRETLGSRSEVRTVPYTAAYPAGFEDLKRRRPDLTKVREAVAFEAKIDLDQTIRDVADWIRSDRIRSERLEEHGT